MNYLKINLSGVLQYFSDNNTITLRKTYNSSLYPTKNAIVGLIASAFGYDRGDMRSDELYNNIKVKYKVIKSPIILEDFQTIHNLKSQNRYMNKFYTKNKFTTISGTIKDRQLTKYVQYLQDSEFDIYIGGIDKQLNDIYNALRNPKYSLYIGKRCCIPNKPLVTEFKLYKEEELDNVYDCS